MFNNINSAKNAQNFENLLETSTENNTKAGNGSPYLQAWQGLNTAKTGKNGAERGMGLYQLGMAIKEIIASFA